MVEKSGGIKLLLYTVQMLLKSFLRSGDSKVSWGLDVVVEKYLAGIVHGMCCNGLEKLWKYKA